MAEKVSPACVKPVPTTGCSKTVQVMRPHVRGFPSGPETDASQAKAGYMGATSPSCLAAGFVLANAARTIHGRAAVNTRFGAMATEHPARQAGESPHATGIARLILTVRAPATLPPRSVSQPRVVFIGWPGSVEEPRLGRRPARRPPGSFWRGTFLIAVGEYLLDHLGGLNAGYDPDPLTTTFTCLCLRLASGAQLVNTRFPAEWPLMWGKRSVWVVPPIVC